jgi:hypothetical protein
MNPRLTRAEFWLLTRVAVYGQSLRALGMPERPPAGLPWGGTSLEEHYNCRGHGLGPRAFARCLYGAIRKDWIQLWRDGSPVENPPSLPEVLTWLSEPGRFADGVYACLSTRGGEVWEAFARPEWDRYIDDFTTFGGDTEPELREVTALDPAWLCRYQETVRAEQSIDRESTFEIADWELTYWKPRVAAYRWTFRAQGKRRPVERPSHYLRSLWCEWR